MACSMPAGAGVRISRVSGTSDRYAIRTTQNQAAHRRAISRRTGDMSYRPGADCGEGGSCAAHNKTGPTVDPSSPEFREETEPRMPTRVCAGEPAPQSLTERKQHEKPRPVATPNGALEGRSGPTWRMARGAYCTRSVDRRLRRELKLKPPSR